MNWFTYIARSRKGRYYVGISPDPLKRIVKHNNGHGSQMARQEGPFVLVYVSTPFADKANARKRENQLKHWTRTKKEKLINKEWA